MKTTLPEPLPQDDPVLVDAVERALAKYKSALSPRTFETFRREALLQLSANPKALALVAAIRPRTAKETTGDEPRERASADEEGGSSSGSDPQGSRWAR